MYMLQHKTHFIKFIYTESQQQKHTHTHTHTHTLTHTHTHTLIYTARQKRIHDLNITPTKHQRATSEHNSVTQNKGREHVKI